MIILRFVSLPSFLILTADLIHVVDPKADPILPLKVPLEYPWEYLDLLNRLGFWVRVAPRVHEDNLVGQASANTELSGTKVFPLISD
jgi:hypothetical protein